MVPGSGHSDVVFNKIKLKKLLHFIYEFCYNKKDVKINRRA